MVLWIIHGDCGGIDTAMAIAVFLLLAIPIARRRKSDDHGKRGLLSKKISRPVARLSLSRCKILNLQGNAEAERLQLGSFVVGEQLVHVVVEENVSVPESKLQSQAVAHV